MLSSSTTPCVTATMRPNSGPDRSTHSASSAVLVKTTMWLTATELKTAAARYTRPSARNMNRSTRTVGLLRRVERAGQLAARPDAELAVRVRQVDLDGLRS